MLTDPRAGFGFIIIRVGSAFMQAKHEPVLQWVCEAFRGGIPPRRHDRSCTPRTFVH
jgi:hypothetical protein